MNNSKPEQVGKSKLKLIEKGYDVTIYDNLFVVDTCPDCYVAIDKKYIFVLSSAR